jgi:hypothetical protein
VNVNGPLWGLTMRFTHQSAFRRFDSLSEIEGLERYARDVRATAQDLDTALGDYEFEAMTPCELHSCHTGHKYGFVVVLKDGRITRVGNRCGGKAFGDKFADLRRAISRDRNLRAIKEGLAEYERRVPEYRQRIEELREGALALDTIGETCRALQGTFPLSGELYERARRRDDSIIRQRVMTKDEITMARATGTLSKHGPPYLVEETVARLRGLKILLDDPVEKVRQVLRLLAKLAALDPAADAKQLEQLHRELGGIDGLLGEAGNLLTEAREFYSPANFANFHHLAKFPHQAAQLNKFRWDFKRQLPVGYKPKKAAA